MSSCASPWQWLRRTSTSGRSGTTGGKGSRRTGRNPPPSLLRQVERPLLVRKLANLVLQSFEPLAQTRRTTLQLSLIQALLGRRQHFGDLLPRQVLVDAEGQQGLLFSVEMFT